VSLDQPQRNVRRTLHVRTQNALGGIATDVCRDRHERDEKEQDKAGFLEHVAFAEVSDDVDTESDAKANGRQMIQQEMNMGQIDRFHLTQTTDRADVRQQAAGGYGPKPEK